LRQFVVAGGDAAKRLDPAPAKEALDDVRGFVAALAEAPA